MRARLGALGVAFLALAVAGCGGGDGDGAGTTAAPTAPTASAASVVEQGPFGRGANAAWLFRPQTAPRSVVVFLHGLGDQAETTPVHHEPWLRHLAAEGSAVIYPRYESTPGADASPLPHALAGVKAAYGHVADKGLPLVVVGYSRGGRLAVELAAVAPAVGLEPRAVLSVFPGGRSTEEPRVDLGGIDPRTRIEILVGDRDQTVGAIGAQDLLHRLEAGGFPADHVRAEVVRSGGGFEATHLSPLGESTGGRRAFWTPADRLVAAARSAAG